MVPLLDLINCAEGPSNPERVHKTSLDITVEYPRYSRAAFSRLVYDIRVRMLIVCNSFWCLYSSTGARARTLLRWHRGSSRRASRCVLCQHTLTSLRSCLLLVFLSYCHVHSPMASRCLIVLPCTPLRGLLRCLRTTGSPTASTLCTTDSL